MLKTISIMTIFLSISNSMPITIDSAIIAGGDALSQLGRQAQRVQFSKPVYTIGIYGRERAVLESEPKLSQFDSAYTYAHNFVADIVGHKPLIDTIEEHEKYGNDAEKVRRVSSAIIDGFEGIANVVNTVLDAPGEKKKQLSKTATAVLNDIGGTLVGL